MPIATMLEILLALGELINKLVVSARRSEEMTAEEWVRFKARADALLSGDAWRPEV